MCFSITSCYYDNEEELYPNNFCDTIDISFVNDIQLKLNNECLACHQSPFPSGGPDLSNYQSVKVIADNSRLFGSLNHDNSFSPMPQGGEKWNECDLSKIRI